MSRQDSVKKLHLILLCYWLIREQLSLGQGMGPDLYVPQCSTLQQHKSITSMAYVPQIRLQSMSKIDAPAAIMCVEHALPVCRLTFQPQTAKDQLQCLCSFACTKSRCNGRCTHPTAKIQSHTEINSGLGGALLL